MNTKILKTIGGICKVKSIVFDFIGDVENICFELKWRANLPYSNPEITDKLNTTAKVIKKLCKDVETKLEILAGESVNSYDAETVQESFIKALKSIKKLCEKNLESIKGGK